MRQMAACLVVVAFLTGCAKKQADFTRISAPEAAPAGTGAGATRATVSPGSGGTPAAGTSRTTASAPTGTAVATGGSATRPKVDEYVESSALADIHFDFDRYDVRDADRPILDRHAAWLKERADTLILVEGHCDERGTPEYNLSLGERRAKTTADYLASRGIAASRITIISYGEQRPACREDSDACRAASRRAHFLVKRR
jgi:peptidoglycan-associated lipoprotein